MNKLSLQSDKEKELSGRKLRGREQQLLRDGFAAFS